MADINLSSLWTSSTGNGVTDDTAIFKKALSMAVGGTLYIPKPSVAYSISNLVVPSNIRIVFQTGTVVQANAGLPVNQALFSVAYATNVTIEGNGATFNMNKTQYGTVGSSYGEGTHTISVIHSSNVTLNNLNVTSSGGGDGFYLNDVTNVTAFGLSASGCKRDGFTLIGGSGVLVQNCNFSNRNGCGIDVEPNSTADVLKNVVFNNILCENNIGGGVALSLYAYRSSTNPTVSNVSFNNITTRNNGGIGLNLSTYASNTAATGAITVNNYTSDGDKGGALEILNNGSLGPSVVANKWNILHPAAYYSSIANYKGVFIRDLSGVNSGKIALTQGTFTQILPSIGTTTTTTVPTTPTTTTTSGILYGTTGNNTITGTTGNDTIYGLAGVDFLSGSSGNDTLWGGAGNDFLTGGSGTDTYKFGTGDGADLITSSSSNSTDTIMFNAGVKLSDLSVKLLSNSSGYKNLVIGSSSTDTITVQNWNYNSGTQLSTVQFEGSATKYKLAMTNGVASWSTIA